MPKELSLIEETASRAPVEPNPMAMLAMAVDRGASIEQLEKLMDLQQRWQANEARMAFTAAMAAFKANPPEIAKDKHVSFETSKGNTSYRHATLGNVCSAIVAGLADHGISHSWKTTQSGQQVTVECILTHSQGHSESVSLSGPLDASGSKNTIQQVGSTITYLQRYTLLSATGLATMETDDDGRAMGGGTQKAVGKVSDPFRPEQPAPPVDASCWQDFAPAGWRDRTNAAGVPYGELADLPDGDKLLGKLWAADKTNPALCAWAADYITRMMRELDMDYEELRGKVPGLPEVFEEMTPPGVWAAAKVVRELKAKAEKGGES